MSEPTLSRRRIRIFHFCPWADKLEAADTFLQRLPEFNVAAKVSDPANPDLVRMARLDCDWHGENTRCFATMTHPQIEFLPAKVTGIPGMLDLAKSTRPSDEEWWLIFDGQNPQKLAGVLGKLGTIFVQHGIRILYYAFDEASRTMPCFAELAPHLSVLIHDESPLHMPMQSLLRPKCRSVHRSWVANFVGFSTPFCEQPEEKILFLGSKLGLTEHRQRQIDFLKEKFGDRFVAFHDHSVSVAERANLRHFKVGLCPEGRKFVTASMGATHTDRPFWCGCLGMVPVSEDSLGGGRLESLHEAGLIMRYPHGDLEALGRACELALRAPNHARRKVYDHFNRFETIGAVVAAEIHAASAHG